MSIFSDFTNLFGNTSKKENNEKEKIITSQEIKDMVRVRKEVEEKTEISQKSIITKLYSLEQLVNILKIEYPKKYEEFSNKIDTLRVDYEKVLEESKKSLTFQINPNKDSKKITKVVSLEKEIREFIDVDMKYDSIVRALQKFILRLNVLYNASIFYYEKKDKVLSQLRVGYLSEKEILDKYNEWSNILGRELEKERLYQLFSYCEYLMFKIYIRNSRVFPNEEYKFNIFYYFKVDSLFSNFKDYMLDELSDTLELISNVKDIIFVNSYLERIDKLNKKIVSKENEQDVIFGKDIWNDYLRLEDEILNRVVEDNNISTDDVGIKVLDKMKISMTENDIFVTPRINSILKLSSIYYGVVKNDALIVTRFLQILSDNISYKDVYFILVLFDMLQDVKNKCKDLYSNIEKYDLRYKYTQDEMRKKKEQVLNSNFKNYILVFIINEYEEKIFREYLTKYMIDYYIKDNRVYINIIYFVDLENIKKDLEENSKNK